MYLFRGEAPRQEFAATLPAPLRVGFRAVGSRFLQDLPLRGGLLPALCPSVPGCDLDLPLVLLGGVNRLETVESALSEGFAFVAMARALLREPDLVAEWEKGVPPRACASTATSACPPSTAEPGACWCRTNLRAEPPVTRGQTSSSLSSALPGTSGASRSHPSVSPARASSLAVGPPTPSGSSRPPSRMVRASGSSRPHASLFELPVVDLPGWDRGKDRAPPTRESPDRVGPRRRSARLLVRTFRYPAARQVTSRRWSSCSCSIIRDPHASMLGPMP